MIKVQAKIAFFDKAEQTSRKADEVFSVSEDRASELSEYVKKVSDEKAKDVKKKEKEEEKEVVKETAEAHNLSTKETAKKIESGEVKTVTTDSVKPSTKEEKKFD